MNLTKGLLIALALTNVLWAYLLVDRSTTIQHHSEALSYEASRIRVLTALVEELSPNVPRSRIVEILQRQFPELALRVDGDTVECNGLLFTFEADKLRQVGTL